MTKTITITNDLTGNIIAQGELGKQVIMAEGNYYFTRESVDLVNTVEESDAYTCPIKKSTCDYYYLKDESSARMPRELCWIYETITNTLYTELAGKIGFYSRDVGNGASISIEEMS